MGTELTAREISPEVLVPVDNADKHPNMFKTLVLLHRDGVFIVVEGCATFEPLESVNEHNEYFYNEHTCPTNYLQVEAVCIDGNMDPHGVFEFVRTVWMTQEYVEQREEEGFSGEDDLLLAYFPELRGEKRGDEESAIKSIGHTAA